MRKLSLARVRVTNIAITMIRRAKTIERAIEKRSHEPMYKTDTKN